MSPIGLIVLLTALAAAGVAFAASGWIQPISSLGRTLEHLRRPEAVPGAGRGTPHRMVAPVVRVAASSPRLLPDATQLRLTGRTLDEHVARSLLAALGGFLVAPMALALLQSIGIVGLGVMVPVAGALAGTVLGPLLVHAQLVEQANVARADLRHQVSAYLDVVTMLLAGNTGYEGALEQAAHAGDGRLFVQLRRNMRESGARGSSLTDALARTGQEFGLEELEQVAATAALSAAEGAPVARTLSAKCATLRTALATEQETEARLRTSRLTTPIVGMALVFMALVMYPALNFS